MRWSAMVPTVVPEVVKTVRPGGIVQPIGPPQNYNGECYTVEALIDDEQGMLVYRDYWKPTEKELAMLNAGGFIELNQFSPQMMMHSMTIWAVE